MTRSALPANVPLIGFAGAPFTLASYLIEGGSSKAFMKTKAFLHEHRAAAETLFEYLTEATIDLLNMQADWVLRRYKSLIVGRAVLIQSSTSAGA